MQVSHHTELDYKMNETGDLVVDFMGGILWGGGGGEELDALISEDRNKAEDCAPLMKPALRAKVYVVIF